MGNAQFFYNSSPSVFQGKAKANSSLQTLKIASHLLPPKTSYDVFLNHRGIDVKETVASLLYYNLQNKGRRVFLDKISIQVGDRIPETIEQAIRTASVHIAIFSPNYADSDWCLHELDLMLKTRAPIIPLFCGIRPSELRMEDKNGLYARSFQKHEQTRKIEARTLQKWKKALREVSYIEGYIFKGDQGELLERIATCAMKHIDAVNSGAVRSNADFISTDFS